MKTLLLALGLVSHTRKPRHEDRKVTLWLRDIKSDQTITVLFRKEKKSHG